MAAVMCQVLPGFFLKKIARKFCTLEYRLRTINITCLLVMTLSHLTITILKFHLKNFSHHIILISSSINELLQKMVDLSFQYQTVNCLYALYKHQIFGDIMDDAGIVFTQLNRAVQHNLENKFVEKLPRVSKKRLSRKKFKKHLMRAEQRNASIQTLRSSFFDRFQTLKKSKYEREL